MQNLGTLAENGNEMWSYILKMRMRRGPAKFRGLA